MPPKPTTNMQRCNGEGTNIIRSNASSCLCATYYLHLTSKNEKARVLDGSGFRLNIVYRGPSKGCKTCRNRRVKVNFLPKLT